MAPIDVTVTQESHACVGSGRMRIWDTQPRRPNLSQRGRRTTVCTTRSTLAVNSFLPYLRCALSQSGPRISCDLYKNPHFP